MIKHVTVSELIRDLRRLLKRTGKVDLPIGILTDADEQGVTWAPIVGIGGAPLSSDSGTAVMWVLTESTAAMVVRNMPNIPRWNDGPSLN